MNITRQKGTRDIYSDDILIWQYVEKTIRQLALEFNLSEIRTPVFEATELFARGVGDETDIVDKEMYTFLDKGDRSITLRPELTAGVVRAYIENGMSSLPSPLKYWYIGNMYRYEKMQKGRYREFSQFGLEIFGSASYLADFEAINVSYSLLKRLGLSDKVELTINSIGSKVSRQNYVKALKDYLAPRIDNMCESCRQRYNKNVLRILDCKVEHDQEELRNAPKILDYLDDESKKDFENLKYMLEKLDIPYVIDNKLVRGLDYYNKTVFEYKSKDLDLAVGGGGRYDELVSTLGGNATPAVGFGLGMDRLILLLKDSINLSEIKPKVDIYFASLTNDTYVLSNKIIAELRALNNEYIIDLDICERSFKAQLKYANNIAAKYVCIIGEDEIKNNVCVLKTMDTGIQEKVKLDANSIAKYISGIKG